MVGKRIWEIDLLRTICISIMIYYHFMFNLTLFLGYNFYFDTGIKFWIARITGATFIFLSGLSSGFSRRSLRRGLTVFGYGLLVTVASYLVLRDDYIRFGILHFLGVSMMLYPLFARLRPWQLLALAGLLIYASHSLQGVYVDTFWLIPLGLRYRGFSSMDYFPLISYLPAFLLGIVAYKLYYYKRQSLFSIQPRIPWIEFISAKSLVIYLLHQPLFLGLIFLYKFIRS